MHTLLLRGVVTSAFRCVFPSLGGVAYSASRIFASRSNGPIGRRSRPGLAPHTEVISNDGLFYSRAQPFVFRGVALGSMMQHKSPGWAPKFREC
jgi:hypothetical protein